MNSPLITMIFPRRSFTTPTAALTQEQKDLAMPPQTIRNTDTHTVNDNTIGLPMSVGSVHNSDIYLAAGFATVWANPSQYRERHCLKGYSGSDMPGHTLHNTDGHRDQIKKAMVQPCPSAPFTPRSATSPPTEYGRPCLTKPFTTPQPPCSYKDNNLTTCGQTL